MRISKWTFKGENLYSDSVDANANKRPCSDRGNLSESAKLITRFATRAVDGYLARSNESSANYVLTVDVMPLYITRRASEFVIVTETCGELMISLAITYVICHRMLWLF